MFSYTLSAAHSPSTAAQYDEEVFAMRRHVFTICLVVLRLCFLPGPASAQGVGTDVFKINYFANNGVSGAPDATVRIDYPAKVETGADSVDFCAMIYVFDNDQQLAECCGCLLTQDGLRTLSVTHDLTNNPLTGVVSSNGVVKIVSSAARPGGCQPGNPESVVPEPAIRAWASHVQNKVGPAYPVTETEFTDATLSAEELSFNLEEQCSFVQRLGSGKGVCSCGTGD
jgi:hypothetical protein